MFSGMYIFSSNTWYLVGLVGFFFSLYRLSLCFSLIMSPCLNIAERLRSKHSFFINSALLPLAVISAADIRSSLNVGVDVLINVSPFQRRVMRFFRPVLYSSFDNLLCSVVPCRCYCCLIW